MSILQENRIKFFYEAAKRGSVRAAADFFDVAPSAISRQISALETELAVVLIERHRRGVKPTEAGEYLLEYYKNRLIEQDNLLESFQLLKGLQKGTLTLAIGEGYISKVSEVLSLFSEKYPAIKTYLSIASTNEVLRMVSEDEAQIGVVFNPNRDPRIRSHMSFNHPMSVVVHKDHELTQKNEPILLKDICKYRLALPDMTHGIRHLVSDIENEAGVILSPTLICNNLHTLKIYASYGGVTLIPAFMVNNSEGQNLELVALPLKNQSSFSEKTHVVTRLGRQLTVGAGHLMQLLIQRIQEI